MGNKPVVAIVLILVILVCGVLVVRNFTAKKSGSQASGAPQEHDLICLSCDKPFKVTMADAEWLPMMMQGRDAVKKAKCPACGKEEGVAAVKCGSCGATVPGGMRDPAAKPATCPKCKKPLAIRAPGPMMGAPPNRPAGPMGVPPNRPAGPPGAPAK